MKQHPSNQNLGDIWNEGSQFYRGLPIFLLESNLEESARAPFTPTKKQRIPNNFQFQNSRNE